MAKLRVDGREDKPDYSVAKLASPSLELIVPEASAGIRVDLALAALLPQHSRSRLQRWLKEGLVLLDGERVDAKRRVWGGEIVRVQPPAEDAELVDAPQAIELDVCYEDASLIVLNKPPGLVVHPGSGNRAGTLLNALLHRLPALRHVARAGIVHRLDKDTSGLMVVAKTPRAQTDLVRQLQARKVRREYIAVVHGVVRREGPVDAAIGRHPRHRTKMAVVASGKVAITHVRVIERFEHHSLIACRLETGRTHQIRVHLQSIGHPLVGDPVYGLRRPTGVDGVPEFRRQALHAERLALLHPESGEPMKWFAPVPADLAMLIERLKR